MALKKAPKHLQSKMMLNLKDLFQCVEEVEDLEFILGLNDCGEVVKISIENLADLIAAQ